MISCYIKVLISARTKNDEIWNYDGFSTGQAPGLESEVYMRPVRIFPDLFNVIVLCETDGVHTDSKNLSKYLINKNADGALTFKNDARTFLTIQMR